MNLLVQFCVPFIKLLDTMDNGYEFDVPNEFDDKTSKEMIDEFLEECPATEDSYINIFGAYYQVMKKILPVSMRVLMWMCFNSELDRGRVIIQSLNLKRLLSELEISRTSYFKSIKDLKEHDVIRGCECEYFLNPRYVWRGSDKRRHKFMAKYHYIDNGDSENDIKTAEI